jgi:hypothetical protein
MATIDDAIFVVLWVIERQANQKWFATLSLDNLNLPFYAEQGDCAVNKTIWVLKTTIAIKTIAARISDCSSFSLDDRQKLVGWKYHQ